MIYGIVVVTYNRLNMLKICIDHIKKQSIKYDKIIVINNCSTDGTEKYLSEVHDIQVENLSQNMGGAGGFSLGIKMAEKLGCNWITVIDDDAILDENFLLNLRLWHNEHSDIKAMCGAVYNKNRISLAYARRFKIDNKNHKVHVWNVPKSEYMKDFFYCDFATFCGVTFNADLIKKIGYPNERYFISFDDTEYTFRMSNITPIALVTAAIIDHRANSGGGAAWKLYYNVRNELYTIKKHFGYKCAWEITKERVAQINQFIRENSIIKKRKAMIWAGIIDAWLGRLGTHKQFRP